MVKIILKNKLRFNILLLILAISIIAALFIYFDAFLNYFHTSFLETEPAGFNPALLSWQQVTSTIAWQARDSHALVEHQDKMWLIGGLNANGYVIGANQVEYWRAPHFSDVWSSADGINWDLVTENAAFGKRRSNQAVSFLEKIWLIPGWGPVEGLKAEVWSSTNGQDWKKEVAKAPWPVREGHELIVFQNKLWLIGGVDYDSRKTMNDVWSSADGINWEQVVFTAPWSGRWDHEVAVFKDKLWLIGGMDLDDNVFSDVWSSVDGINWELVTNTPPWQTRQGHEAVVFNDIIWILGRFNDEYNGGENDVWYSTDGFVWKKTNENPEWLGREDQAAIVFKNKIWLTGGMDKNWTWNNEIWYSN
jgi:hypothetical protein